MHPSTQTTSPDLRRGRVLVTGGAGFIGTALVERLLSRGQRVTVVDDFSGGYRDRLPRDAGLQLVEGDAGDASLLRELLQTDEPFEHLVHFAAVVGVRRVLADPEGCRDEHTRLAGSIESGLRAVAEPRRPRLIAASTSEVYAESPAALREDGVLRPTTGTGRWAYAGSKRAAEQRFDGLAGLWPTSEAPVHLRFFNVIGPGQDAESGMVLPRFVERARAGLPLEVHGDGEQERTFAHVDEVARTLCELLEHPALPAGALNVGGRARTSIGTLAELVRDRVGGNSRVVRVDPRANCGANFEDVRRRVPDLARLRSLGVHVPSRGLLEIVDDCVARHPRAESLAGGAGRNVCASPAS